MTFWAFRGFFKDLRGYFLTSFPFQLRMETHGPIEEEKWILNREKEGIKR